MSERLPYEEKLAQQLNDLPLPDENMAWADMKRRLDDDDDDGLIPIWLRGCALWGIAIVLLIGLGWWIFQPQKWFEKKQTSQKEQPVTPTNHKDSSEAQQKIPTEKTVTINDSLSNIKRQLDFVTTDVKSKKPPLFTNGRVKHAKSVSINNRASKSQTIPNKKIVTANPGIEQKPNPDISKNSEQESDSSHVIQNPQVTASSNKPDTTVKNKTDSLQQKQPTVTTKASVPKKDSSEKNHFSYSAGLALFQQLPLAGQKLTPYNAEGRTGSITDYIPTPYFRLIRNNKWFLQAEFRYGAPQNNKEFLYSKRSDTFSSTITSTSLTKTFYHQLPVTFNYFITDHWSVGAGITWNKFVSAVSSQDVFHHNPVTGADSLIVQDKIISTKSQDTIGMKIADTNFVKSYFQGVFETQYQWKRFSVGVRYSFGLQPYIKFKLPGGAQQQEKNQAVNIFIRYDLWRSRKQ